MGRPSLLVIRRAGVALLFLLGGLATGARAQAAFGGAQRTLPFTGLAQAISTAVDATGNVYVLDNGLGEVVELAAGTGTQTTVATGISSGQAIAVDSGGNVYVAESGSPAPLSLPAQVIKIAPGGSQSTVTVTGLGDDGLGGIAVDAAGNLYIADLSSSTVVEVPASGSQTTLGFSGLAAPDGVAVDAAGDVFVADTSNNRVVELPFGSSSQITVASGLNDPNGLAVDGTGNLYTTEASPTNLTLELPAGGGSPIALGAGMVNPAGVAVDSSGNLYVAVASDGTRVVEIQPAGLNFGSVNAGTAGATGWSLIYNFSGSETLTAASVTTQGASGLDFAPASAGSTCTVGTFGTGTNQCLLDPTFTPQAPGVRLGAATLSTSSGTLITTYITGTGVGPAATFGPGTGSVIPTTGLNDPFGTTVDASGNVYIVNFGYTLGLPGVDVVKIAPGGGQTTVASGFVQPAGVAVDGAGNLYIADNGAGAVYKAPADGTAQTTVASGLGGPYGVTVDGAGDLYIADTGSNNVYKVAANGGARTTVVSSSLAIDGKTINEAFAVAVDGAGNLYIADGNNGRVVKIPAHGGTPATVVSGLEQPTGVAVDGVGNLYVADFDHNRILELPAGGTTPVTVVSSAATFGSPALALSIPAGVAADGAGNLYIVDSGNDRLVKLDLQDPPTLDFAATAYGATSAAQTVTVGNGGNANLTISSLSVSSGFAQQASGGTDCSATTTVAPDAGCAVQLASEPNAVGSLSGSAILTDNTLNANTPQSIALNGSGTQATPTISWAAPAAITYGTALSSTQLDATSGGVAGNFAYTPAAGAALDAGANQTLSVTFTPTDTTDYTSAIGGTTISVAQATPAISWTPSTTEITTTGVTGAGLTAGVLDATTAVPGNFAYTINSNPVTAATVEPVGQYTITATFTPNDTADYTSAIAQQTITVEFGTYAFPSQAVGTPSAPVTITIVNPGSSTATITGVSALTQGATGRDFTLGGTTCSGTVAAGATCTFTVAFTPAATGLRSGAIALQVAGQANPATFYISGAGSGPVAGFSPATENRGGSFSAPSGVAEDAAGNLYVTNQATQSVIEIPAAHPSAPATYLSGFITDLTGAPTGIAMDGAGNLAVADQDGTNSQIFVFAPGGTTPTQDYTGFNQPSQLAYDGAGNLYVADTKNTRVVEITPQGNQTALGFTGLANPNGVAVDAAGDVFAADSGSGSGGFVTELPAGGGAQVALGSGWVAPQALASIPGGFLLVTDDGQPTGRQLLAQAVGGGAAAAIGSGWLAPEGVLYDGAGNAYVVDSGNNQLVQMAFSIPQALAFPTAGGVGGTPQSLTTDVFNLGNASLTFSSIGVSAGASAYSLASGSGACPASGSLAVGASCGAQVEFAPAAVGAATGTVTFSDNNLNAAGSTQALAVSGTGVAGATAAVAVTAGGSQSTFVNNPFPTALQATIEDASGNPVLTSNANVTFTAPASGASGTFSNASKTITVAAVNGIATAAFAANTVAGGPYAVAVTSNGLAAGAASLTNNPGAAAAIASGAGSGQSALISAAYATLLSASVADAYGNPVAGATVTFAVPASGASGAFANGTASTTASTNPGGVATATVLTANTVPGAFQATASVSGAATAARYSLTNVATSLTLSPTALSFAGQLVGSASAAQAVTLTNPNGAAVAIASIAAGGDFAETNNCGASLAAGQSCTAQVTFSPSQAGARAGTLTITDNLATPQQTAALSGTGTQFSLTLSGGASQSIEAGSAATYTLTLAPGTFTGAVALSCSGAPANATCAASPGSATLAAGGAATTVTVTVSTTARSLAPPPPDSPQTPARPWLLLLALAPLPFALRHRNLRGWLLGAAAGAALLAAGCGGNANNLPAAGGGTPSGAYTITVAATAGQVAQSVHLGLSVE